VEIGEYAYVMPYIEDDKKLFFENDISKQEVYKKLYRKGGI